MKINKLKFLIIIPCLLITFFIVNHQRQFNARRALRTKESPLKIVKTEPGCVLCGTTVGYLSEIVTYSYQHDGRTINYVAEYENSRRSHSRPNYTKICYDPHNHDNAVPVGDDYNCPQ